MDKNRNLIQNLNQFNWSSQKILTEESIPFVIGK